jgi:hypothetical protein
MLMSVVGAPHCFSKASCHWPGMAASMPRPQPLISRHSGVARSHPDVLQPMAIRYSAYSAMIRGNDGVEPKVGSVMEKFTVTASRTNLFNITVE